MVKVMLVISTTQFQYVHIVTQKQALKANKNLASLHTHYNHCEACLDLIFRH